MRVSRRLRNVPHVSTHCQRDTRSCLTRNKVLMHVIQKNGSLCRGDWSFPAPARANRGLNLELKTLGAP
eukprot:4231405-Amphidinium_carterae.1